MSRFFTKTLSALEPYTPGEQPQDIKYIKLNTNESPFEPSAKAKAVAAEHERALNLYSDPSCKLVIEKLAEIYDVDPANVILGNGSDELLFFSFRAFCDEDRKAVFPDISYGFYPVFAQINKVPYKEIPLKEDLSIDTSDYKETGNTIYIANPNAPTGLTLPVSTIEELVKSHPDDVVVIDEAYVDFGGDSCVRLTKKFDNILVIQTFSKSRSMAGMRIGFAIGNPELIKAMNDVKFSINSYTMNQNSLKVGIEAVKDKKYFEETVEKIIRTRENTKKRLAELGFEFTDSKANYIFATHKKYNAKDIFEYLKSKDIFVRYFNSPRIDNYLRITIGTDEEMDKLIETLTEFVK